MAETNPSTLRAAKSQSARRCLAVLHKVQRLLLAHSCPGGVRWHVRSWRKLTPHSKAHPLANRSTD